MKYQLYIKESPLGLKYLGMHTSNNKYDVNSYIGSGKRWLNHVNHHGFKAQDIKTDVIAECETLEHFKIVGQYYSDLFCVVDSPEWANLKPETGHGGPMKHTIETKNKIRKKLLGINSGSKNPMFGTISPSAKSITINGKTFTSIKAACKYFNICSKTLKKYYNLK